MSRSVPDALPTLRDLLQQFRNDPAWASLEQRLAAGDLAPATACQEAGDRLEPLLWQAPQDPDLLARYQRLHREREALPSAGPDPRHRFVVVIPVADRPRHLANCLNSLHTLCATFHYGGQRDGRYPRVAALVLDDSQDPGNREAIRAVAADCHQRGIDTRYLSPAEQCASALRLTREQPLPQILGPLSPASRCGHKGASVTRNLAYLSLWASSQPGERVLYHFVDSDQEFQVPAFTDAGPRDVYALNYFHHLDRVFRETGARILTGKVVGAPPVSPAVMAGNLLEDLIALLAALADLDPAAPCQFHGAGETDPQEAAYHDMAELFGFRPSGDSRRYHCPLTGANDHRHCLADLAGRLDGFFDGEHPTRRIPFEYQPPRTLTPARTLYTGNYVLHPAALEWFIPFAPLKLRMAGPTLGRILRRELGDRFVSANLPMLHRRTLPRLGQSEFRPGIHRQRRRVDLAEEFERQYFGDLMLFAMERLTDLGFPRETAGPGRIADTLSAVEADLGRRYGERHQRTRTRLQVLERLFRDPQQWWQQIPDLAPARTELARFLDNLAHNFGDRAAGYRRIGAGNRAARQRRDILQAIAGYATDRDAWRRLLANRAFQDTPAQAAAPDPRQADLPPDA